MRDCQENYLITQELAYLAQKLGKLTNFQSADIKSSNHQKLVILLANAAAMQAEVYLFLLQCFRNQIAGPEQRRSSVPKQQSLSNQLKITSAFPRKKD